MGKLIGLSGYARSGKNTVADILTSEQNFSQVSFAQPMRDALYELNPIVRYYGDEYWRVQDVINHWGWDDYKASPFGTEIRALLQRFGTEVGRDMFGEDFWVNLAMAHLPTSDVVFTDVRFPNEARAIKKQRGEIWRINRPGIEPTNNHASETSMDDWEFDVVIDNDGTLDELKDKVRGLI